MKTGRRNISPSPESAADSPAAVRADTERLFSQIGPTGEIARARGVSPAAVSTWKARGAPIEQWQPLVDLARAKGARGVSIEAFARLAVRRCAVVQGKAA